MSEEQPKVDETVVDATGTDEVKPIDPKDYADLKAEVIKLREHNEKVVQDRKDKSKAADEKVATAEKEKAEKEGDYKKLLELKDRDSDERSKAYQQQIDERDAKLSARDELDRQREVNNTAMRLATDLAKTSAKKAETLRDILVKRLKLTDDGVKVVDDKGELLSDNLDVLKEFAKKEYDFLCDGIQSTGGAGVFKSTDNAQDNIKLDPVARINAARGIT